MADTNISGARVARELDALVRVYGTLARIVSDNGTEFTSRARSKWANEKDVEWHCIDPGKPQRNAFIEAFSGSFRDELLSQEWFDSLEHARRKLARCRSGDTMTTSSARTHHWRTKHLLKRVVRRINLRAQRPARVPKLTTKNIKTTPANARYE